LLAELISSNLKMEAICSSETSVDTQRTTPRHIPENDIIHNHRCGNLKSYTSYHVGCEVLTGVREEFMLGLLYFPEDVGDIFLRNFCGVSSDYTTLYPRR
jgi:hypothetical protein